MVRKINIIFLLTALHISFTNVASQQNVPCDPFETGSTVEIANAARAKGEIDPDSCLCSSPCTVDKASELVRFYYIKKKGSSYRELNVKNPASSKLYNYKGHVKFLAHGYTEQGTKGWLPPTGKQLSNTFNGYVILIDYGAISNCSANRSVFEILPSVGYFVADVIRNYHLDLKKVECVGHSFGAHVCGYAGASLNGAMQRIIGLDPAKRNPMDTLYLGLNKTCAQFVQVLHTDPNGLGTAVLRGNVDFYANIDSVFQPGCTMDECGHFKAIYYYYASLFPQNHFIGGDCRVQDSTNSQYTSIFGAFNEGKSGIFCIQTTPCFPYARTIVQSTLECPH